MRDKNDVRRYIESGDLDERLKEVYSISGESETAKGILKDKKDRLIEVVEGFQKEFPDNASAEIGVFSAPGRTEIGGNHTDHQLGSVFAGGVNYDVISAAAPNEMGVIRFYSDGYGLSEIDLSELEPNEAEYGTTAALIRGMAGEMKKRGHNVEGFDAFTVSNVPSGSGISSSAAFEVLVGNIINALSCGGAFDAVEIAKIGQTTENEYFGKPSGLMDQMASSVGKAVGIDFADKENPVIEAVDLNLNDMGYSLVIIDTHSSHEDLTHEYAAIPEDMRKVAAELGAEVLSQVDYDDFIAAIPELREKLDDRAVLRALHYFGDTKRAKDEAEAVRNGDFDEFLRLVNESGDSSVLALQNIVPAGKLDDQSVALALALAKSILDGKGAVRVHGGGFAGTIQAFVPTDVVEDFVERMDAVLGEGSSKIMSIRPVGGIELL